MLNVDQKVAISWLVQVRCPVNFPDSNLDRKSVSRLLPVSPVERAASLRQEQATHFPKVIDRLHWDNYITFRKIKMMIEYYSPY